MNHTPEPLVYGLDASDETGFPAYLLGRNGCLFACVAGAPNLNAEQEARRLCASYNACQNIPSEALENGVLGELIEALEAADLCIGELTPTQSRVEVAQMIQSVLARLKPESEVAK